MYVRAANWNLQGLFAKLLTASKNIVDEVFISCSALLQQV